MIWRSLYLIIPKLPAIGFKSFREFLVGENKCFGRFGPNDPWRWLEGRLCK